MEVLRHVIQSLYNISGGSINISLFTLLGMRFRTSTVANSDALAGSGGEEAGAGGAAAGKAEVGGNPDDVRGVRATGAIGATDETADDTHPAAK